MELITVVVPIRGKHYELEAPGPDAPPEIRAHAQMEMLVLALVAMNNPEVDAVLDAFSFVLQTGDGEQIYPVPE